MAKKDWEDVEEVPPCTSDYNTLPREPRMLSWMLKDRSGSMPVDLGRAVGETHALADLDRHLADRDRNLPAAEAWRRAAPARRERDFEDACLDAELADTVEAYRALRARFPDRLADLERDLPDLHRRHLTE